MSAGTTPQPHPIRLEPQGLVLRAANACLERIAERDNIIRAWKFIDAEVVRNAAVAADRVAERERGALHGMLVGVKDIFDTADMPTGYGSPIYDRNQPSSDAAAVALLRSNGAIVVGKTVSTEFASWPPSVTHNPRDPLRTPGGSSSGSAAAVADGMIAAGLGTQTLGSVIRPSSYCGIVGFKPTFGRINRAGVKPLADSLDTVGVLAGTLTDAERVYRALSGAPRPAVSDMTPALAFCRANWHLADEDARRAIESFVQGLRKAGIEVDDIDIPDFTVLTSQAKLIQDFELWRGLCFERTRCFEQFSVAFQAGLRAAARLTFEDYEQALRTGEEARVRYPDLVSRYDAVLCLSATGEAPRGLQSTGDPSMNSAWTLLHVPCVTIPVLKGASGMPIGLQVVAPRFQDDTALRVANWLQNFQQQQTVPQGI